jgi:hypothetical protein
VAYGNFEGGRHNMQALSYRCDGRRLSCALLRGKRQSTGWASRPALVVQIGSGAERVPALKMDVACLSSLAGWVFSLARKCSVGVSAGAGARSARGEGSFVCGLEAKSGDPKVPCGGVRNYGRGNGQHYWSVPP